jgi:hypothetical protein
MVGDAGRILILNRRIETLPLFQEHACTLVVKMM